MDGPPRVVGICGSHREESTSRTALLHALAAAEAEGAETDLLDLRSFDLPPYGGADRDAGDGPEIRRRVREADAVVLATPIYHGSVASPLKTALDYCGFDEFEDTLVGIVVTAGGRFPVPAILHLRTIARWVRAWVLPTHVGIPNASDAIEGGEVVDPDYADRLETLGVEIARYAYVGRLPELLAEDETRAEPAADD
ncbi:MAG: NADPH-dependent FMN reductase [Halobacteriales archaeon]